MNISEKCLKKFQMIEEYLLSEEGDKYFYMMNKHEVPTNLKKVEVNVSDSEEDEII